MKFKREIMAIILIICMLFTISAISAADSSTDALSATNATVEASSEDVANDNNLAMENDVESLGDGESSEVGTFADLKSDIDITNVDEYSTILLNRSYKFTDSVDTNGLTISKSITIDGQGHTIDANGKNRVFYFATGGKSLVFKNIIFINGSAPQGGAISSYAGTASTSYYKATNVEIINCTFINNTATSSSNSYNGHGGAIYIGRFSNQVNIINSTFIDNKAYDNSGKYGGAIYINAYYATAGCNIINSTFINNYANYDGGVIWLRGKSNVNQIVDGCIFINNTGGNTVYSSVFKGDNSGNFIINNSIFLNNKKYAVNIGPSTYSLENNWWGNTEDNFNTNMVSVYSKSVTSWLFLKFETDDATGTATISLNNLYSSSSEETSVYEGKFPSIEFNIESTNMNVDKNTVKLDSEGKATFHYELTGAVGVLTISYNNINMTKTFKDLSFSSLKNMIINSQEPTIYLDEDFTYDETKDSALSDGIDFAKSITIDGQGHTLDAKDLKRIFYINDPTKDVVLKNINFVNGNADIGGAINAIVNSLTLINCTFINNTANTYGGAVALNANTGEITENTFINNEGSPVIYFSGDGNYNIHDSMINAQNIAVDGESTATINANYNWWGNTADNYATSIVNVGSSVTRENWLFLNMITDDKKALAEISLNNLYTIGVGNSTYTTYALPEITLNIVSSNVKVNKNNVKIDETGKASLSYIVKTTGSVTASYNDEIGIIKDVTYDDDGNFKSLYNLFTNVADNGDTIELNWDYNYDSSTDSQLANQMQIQKTIVIDGKGHTIDAKGQTNVFKVYNVKVTFKNIIFVNGYSSYGGAVYYRSDIEGEFINCTFINNFASYYGGAIYDYNGNLNIVGSTFINNTASSSGSAIYAYNDVVVSNSIFLGNEGEYIIAGSSSITANNNWWGHTIDNYETPLSIGSTVTANNWYVLDMSVDIGTVSKLTLNNLYDGNVISIDNNYALPTITFNTKSTNTQLTGNSVIINDEGEGNIEHTFSKKYSITASYNGVELTKSFVNCASFTELKTQINEDTNELILDQNYAFDSNVDTPNDIIFSKTLTIDGAGFTIDAKGLSNIFHFDDDSNTKTLLLKNIIFANATGENGAAVYFNGNRIEVVNCTFINNTANGQGAAIYVNGANNNVENKIVQSTFINNTCVNSIIYLNSVFSDASFVVSNSVIVNNEGVTIAKGAGNVNVDYNWWGNNATNYNIDIANAGEGITIEKWFYLNMTVDDEIKKAEISLNNLNDGSDYSYTLPELIFDISAVNANLNKNNLILDLTGKNTVDYSLTGISGLLTASYNGVGITKEIKFLDKGDFDSLQNILNLIPEGYMYKLTRNYTYSESDTITTGILVDKYMGIDGNGFTVDAKGKSRIFNLAADGILLKNINLINGKSSSGAAVYTSSKYISIDNSTFINNTATGDGGAIYINSYYSGSITNSKFINNSADEDGAAIFTYAYYVVADIDRCIFINNTASFSSVIYAYKCKVKNSIFLDNPGNMIRGYYSDSHVINYNWFGNTFDNYVDSPSMESPVTNWLYLDIKFYEDYAVVLLNKLYNSNSASSSTFSDYKLPEITLNVDSTTLDLHNVKNITLDSNGRAEVPYSMIGDSGSLTVSYKDISLTKERVVGDFDALQDLINKNDEIELDRDYTYISGVDDIAGGILINKNITIDGKGHTIDTKEMSRIFNVQALNVTFKNIIFTNGKSNVKWDDGGNPGGAICYNLDNTESINFNVINCTFVDNTANVDNYNQNYPGGAIYIKANNGKFNITDSIFKNNKATGTGGAIYLNTKNSEFNLYNLTFVGNTANNGGALYVETNGTAITIDKCLFRENGQTGGVNSAGYGSAIRWITTNDDDKDNVVKNSIFLDNIPDKLNKNNYGAFSYGSGNVNINDNWWGTNALNNPNELYSGFIDGGITPTSWLYIDGIINSSTVYVNEPVAVKFILKLYDQSLGVCDYDNDNLPFVNFNISSYSSDYGVADKSFASLNEEIIYVAAKAAKQDIGGPAVIASNINSGEFWFKFTQKEHSIISILVDNPLTMYNGKNYNFVNILKFVAKQSKINIETSDSSVVDLGLYGYDINAVNEGTAIISFDYNGADADIYDETSVDLIINVRKIPMQIVVTNFESDEISVYATDTIYLNVTLLVDDVYEQYATNQWGSLKFTKKDDGVNGNIFYTKNGDFTVNGASVNGTFSCDVSQVGTSNLTLYIDNKLYDCENAVIKFTIDKKPTAIELDHADSLEFKVDDTSKINATIINGTVDAQLKYQSNNTDVVTVNESTGELSAVGSGTVIITVKYGGNAQRNESTKKITVTVNKYSTTTSLDSHDPIELEIDETSQVSATLTAEDNADLGSPIYVSSDETVATVDQVTGEITAVGEGTTTITAKYDATRRYADSSDTVTVTVRKISTSITLTSDSDVTIDVFADSQIEATLNPSTAGSLSYKSSNESVVTVDSTGKITAVAGGKANITISFAGDDDRYAAAEDVNVSVTVNKLPTEITVNPTIAVDVDATNTIEASADHGRALEFVSLDESIVTVDSNGVITGVIGGKANVTVRFAEDDQYLGKEVNVTVTVNKIASTITVNPIEINVFDSQLIIPTVVSDGVISYVSCDPTIVTVNTTNGNITGIKGGKANVTIRVAEGEKYLAKDINVTVTVNKLPTEITVNPTISVDVDGSNTIEASADHGRALEFVSLDESIVTVDSNGVITGVIGGKANVTVSFAEDDQYLAKEVNVTVTVNKLQSTFQVNNIDLSVDVYGNLEIDASSNSTITYTSLDTSVAAVSGNVVTGVKGGVVNITLSVDETDKFLSNSTNITVTVNKLQSQISVNPTNTIVVDDINSLDASVDENRQLRYVSTNPDIITVDDNGIISGVKGGIANVTVIFDEDDQYLGSEVNVTVTVNKANSTFAIENVELSVNVDGTVLIVASSNNDGEITYLSLDSSFATVSGNVVTGVKGGVVNITLSVDETEKYLANSTNVSVTVNKLNSTFAIDEKSLAVDVYGTVLIIASSNNDGEITYLSLDASVATVDGNVVTGVKGGVVNITLSVDETDRYLANSTNVTVTVNKLQSIIIVDSAVQVDVDATKSIGAAVNEERQLKYESANQGIVTVDEFGNITGIIGGVANVTVIFEEDDQYLGSEVNVSVRVNKLNPVIDVNDIIISVYENRTLSGQIITDGEVSYISINPSISTVNETGGVSGIIGGKTNITIATTGTERYNPGKANVTVTVNKLPSIFTNHAMSLSVDENATIASTLNHPGNVRYEFDASKLNVTEKGLVIAIAGGVHTINLFFDEDEKYLSNSSQVIVTVSRLPADYEDEPINLTVFDQFDAEHLITGYNRTNSIYSTTNASVFTVDKNGLITAVAGGSANLTIRFDETDRYLGDEINITVNVKKLSSLITVDSESSLKVFETKNINAIVSHGRKLAFESSNPDIVSVDEFGNITGMIGGTAYITVKFVEDGQYLETSAQIRVTVNKLPSKINVDTLPFEMFVDDEKEIIAATDNDGGLFYTTNSNTVSIVNNKVIGISEGTAEIIIVAFETDKYLSNKTTLQVTVKKIPTEIGVDSLEISINVNQNKSSKATLNHPEAGDLTYISSNPDVAIVDENGIVTGIAGGKVNITISFAGDNKYIASQDVNISVTVNKLPTMINVKSIDVDVDDSKELGAIVNNGGTLVYESLNPDIVTVNDEGVITGVTGGTGVINISFAENGQYLANSTTVTVTVNKLTPEIAADSIDINVFESLLINPTIVSDGEVSYVSCDSTIATVNATNGNISAIKGGKTNITIKVAESSKYLAGEVNVTLTINKLPTEITVNLTIAVDVDATNTIEASADNGRALEFVSLDESIVTVDSNGVITGVIGGKANVTVRFAEDDQYLGKEVNVTVTVNKLQSTFNIHNDDLSVVVYGNLEINASSNSTITYTSLDSSIATVDGNVVTGVKGGVVNITLSVDETDKFLANSINITVTVNKLQSVIAVNSTIGVDVDNTNSIGASASENRPIRYESTNSDIVTIDKNGIISGIKGGIANVTVIFDEDDQYLGSEVNVTVTVNKLNSTFIIGEKELSVDADGNVSIVVSSNNDGEITYTSLDSSIATVDGNVVTGVKGGVVNIILSVDETDKYLANSTSITVTVNKLTSTITVDPIGIDVFENQLINPTVVGDGVISYVSCDQTVVTVNATNGNISAIKGGKTNITIKVAESDKYLASEVNVTVTVNKIPTTIIVNQTISVDYGKTNVIEASADGRTLEFISLDESIVTVDETGLITAIKGGVANVTVRFTEDDYYLGDEVNVSVTVNRLPITIAIIDANNVIVGGTSTIKLSINETDTTALVIVNVNGTEYPINISKTKSLNVVLDKVGNYDVYAIYQGDDKYQTAESNLETIKASPKYENEINVNVTQNIKTGDRVEINATSESGSIEIYVDGVNQTVSDGKVILDSLSVGEHTIKVVSPETANYVANSTEFSIVVGKKQAEIKISVEGDLIADSIIKINIENTGSSIIVYMDGKALDNYEESFKATSGNHLIVATVIEDEQYLGCSETYNFTVSKKSSQIYVSGTTVKVGEASIIEVSDLPNDATGIVIINLNGADYSLNITENKSLSVVLDNPGIYDISAKYIGDDKYLASESVENTILVEDKKASTIEVEIPTGITAGSTVTIDISSNNKELEALVDGAETDIINGILTIENISSGIHKIEVIAKETSDLKANLIIESFNVAKKEADIKIELPENIVLGDDVEINVTSYDGADITVYLDGEKQTFKEGKVTIKATVGSHTIIATAAESDEYLKSSANKTFTVDKLNPQISLSGLNITEGGKTIITIDTPLNEGVVSVKVVDTETLIDLAKTKSLEVQLDTPGDYEISAIYLANDNYNSFEAKTTVNVAAKETPSVEITNLGDANQTEIEISLPADASGTLTVTVDGNKTYSSDVINGSASVSISDLSAGTHDIAVSYSGDGKYGLVTKNATVDVPKVEIPENATDVGITIPEGTTSLNVDVNLPVDATGEVTVTVDGNESYSADVVNGSASVVVSDLSVGNHSISVSYSGDDKYLSVTKGATIDVPKAEVENVTVVNMTIPEGTTSPVFNITLPSDAGGNITVTVDGNKTYTASVVNGTVSVNISDLSVGTHNIVVSYSGDDKYEPVNKESTVDVPKAEIPDNATKVDISIPEGTTSPNVDVGLPSDANGNVTVVVDDNETFTVDVVNGTANVDLGQMAVGNHNITIIYSGNEKYVSKSQRITLDVPKALIPENATEVDMNVPENTTSPVVNVTLPSDASGTLTVTVDGDKTYTASVINGTASLNIPDLSTGKHDVTVSYSGDGKYEPVTRYTSVNVPKVDIDKDNVKIDIELPVASKSPTVNITLPSDATGYIVVNNSGVCLYNPVVNGSSSINLGALAYGEHNVTISYSGDDKYNPAVKNTTVDVPKPVLTAKNTSYRYSKVIKYKTRVTVNGKAVVGKYVTFKFKGKTYKRLTDKNGYATLNIYTSKFKVGKYSIVAKFNDVSITKKVKITNIIVAKNLKAKKTKALKFKVKLKPLYKKYLKGKTLKIKLNGKTYKAKTNKKGVATFKIPKKAMAKLKVGKTYKLKITYKKDVITKKLKIRR